MKPITFLLLIVSILSIFSTNALAYRKGQSPKSGGYTQDAYGHWTSNSNLYNDSDGDGVSNYNDRSDSNSMKW